MSKNGKILVIAGVIILFVVLLYLFGGGERKKQPEQYVTDVWIETYDPADRGPYGTNVLKELLDTVGLFGNFLELNEELSTALKDNEEVNDIYFFIGSYNFLEDVDAEYLYDFLLEGNSVFMACDYFPEPFISSITRDADSLLYENTENDSVQHVEFTHPDLMNDSYESKYIFENKGTTRTWQYMRTDVFSLFGDDTLFVLGRNDQGKANFLRVKYGEGNIYLHSTPYQFTNIAMMKRRGFEYVEKVLAHIPPGRIQWDRYNLESHYSEEGDDTGGEEDRRSILEFLMNNPPLMWASIVLLLGALLYAIFRGKRRQRIIPATEAKDNTSMQYITTLASLYMQENQHNKLIKLKERTFLNFLADHYYITSKVADEKFISRIAMKSGIEKERIAEIFKLFRVLENKMGVTDEDLILLHQKIEYFYKKCQ